MKGLDALLKNRRAYRALRSFDATDLLIDQLAGAAALAPSCFNNQPWRYVFVRDAIQLEKMWSCMSKGNEWTRGAGMIAALVTRTDWDCQIGNRRYENFDTGLATAFMILKATEMGLIAHPIAGFDPIRVKKILEIPEDLDLIVLIVFGQHAVSPTVWMNEKQIISEQSRPTRLPLTRIRSLDKYQNS